MKKFLALLSLLALLSTNSAFAASGEIQTLQDTKQISNENPPITLADCLTFFAKLMQNETPQSYQYISLNYTGIIPDSPLENALQILVYNDKIQNNALEFQGNTALNLYVYQNLSEKILGVSEETNLSEEEQKNTLIQSSDLGIVSAMYEAKKKNENKIIVGSSSSSSSLGEQGRILEDVYKTLTKDYYSAESLDTGALLEAAIVGMTEAVGDKYTSYFPPVESENFISSLDGNYEGIGAYVELTEPGKMMIVSPIVGSPAEKAGLKGGDQILKVWDNTITEENSSDEIISWIKGPAGTSVTLTILRGTKTIEIEVVRDTIVITEVEYEELNSSTAYIQIKTFGENVDSEFKTALENISENKRIKKIIFDLRNNPGGYLGKVSNMLGYFLEGGNATAIVSDGERDFQYTANANIVLDLSKYEVIILQNSGSASASEIFTGTLKDYFPETTIIGEKSYGKGSVQTLKSYKDGSMHKYTTAKWYTGKTRTGIDKVGILPDIEIMFDENRYEKYGKDNQLEKALAQ